MIGTSSVAIADMTIPAAKCWSAATNVGGAVNCGGHDVNFAEVCSRCMSNEEFRPSVFHRAIACQGQEFGVTHLIHGHAQEKHDSSWNCCKPKRTKHRPDWI